MATSSAYKSPKAYAKAMASYDNALTRWPIPYESLLLKTSFGKTWIMKSGPEGAKPLVLLHGGGGNSGMWIYNIEKLSQYFQVYSIDIIGEAGKSAGTRPGIKTNGYSLWLKEVFDTIGLEKAILCGASLGGTLAHGFADLYPESVEALVLIAAPSLARMRFPFIFRAILANALPGDFFAKSFLNYICMRGADFSEWMVKGFIVQVQSYKPPTAIIPVLSDSELSKLPAKTLIFIGQEEVLYKADAVASRIRSVAPHITVSLIPDAKHMLSIDQPDVFNDQLIHFAQSLASAVSKP